MHSSPTGQRPVTASEFICYGEALTRVADKLFGTPCETRLIAYNMKTGDFTDTPKLADLTDALFKGSEHVHLAIKPISEKNAKGYVTEHGNHMPAFARLQVLEGKPLTAEINGAKIDLNNLPVQAATYRQASVAPQQRATLA